MTLAALLLRHGIRRGLLPSSSSSLPCRSFAAASLSLKSSSTSSSSSSSSSKNAPPPPLRKTALFDFHVRHGATMTGFCGWDMPLQYSDLSVVASHRHTRERASLFDVSHMLQYRVNGKDGLAFMEGITVSDLETLPNDASQLTVFTNPNGGIIDDTVVTRHAGYISGVSNAGRANEVRQHLQEKAQEARKRGLDVAVEFIDRSLLALQGPLAKEVLPKLMANSSSPSLNNIAFMQYFPCDLKAGGKAASCRVTRCGYTGEDGFEISVAHEHAVSLAEELLASGVVKNAGLASRDSLRLEAGLCLYGNDIDESTTPVEASLIWCIGKRQRERKSFAGAEKILSQLKGGSSFPPSRKRVGLVVTGAPARPHYPVLDAQNKAVGEITSGQPSPSTGKFIAMAYVPFDLSKEGTALQVSIRKKNYAAEVVKMPFVPHNYYRRP